MDFLELCKKRYSGRGFDRRRPIEKETLRTILEAARLAPTGCNAQQWKILLVESPEGLRKAEACSSCIYDAPTLLLFTYDDAHEDSHLEINHVNVGLTNCAISATHAMLAAAERGVGSCWVCWFDENAVQEQFHLPDHWKPACMILLGYDQQGPSERHFYRKPLEELVESV